MSAPTTTAAAPPQAPAAPATFAEIVAACAGCDASGADDSLFVCDQLRLQATVPQAQQAWMKTLKARADLRAQEAAEQRQRADEAARQAARPDPGNPPVPTSTAAPSATDTGDPSADWNAALEEQRAKGKRGVAAALAADKAHPGLRQRMIAATNAN
jgi:hypothetical protein